MKGFRQSTRTRLWLTLGLAAAALLAFPSADAQGIPPGMRLQPNAQPKPSAAVPVMPPTAPTAPAPLSQVSPAPTASTTHRAHIDYVQGVLTITANNSSLNQILRDIARQTGLQITGGVTDERVFGTYGPADLPTILAVLLDGTGSNMMLSGDNPNAPKLLTLTARQGGVTPPSPQQIPETDAPEPAPDLPPQQTPQVATTSAAPAQQINPAQPFTPPAAQPDTATPAAATTTTEQSPNGVKTPQQIYDQLMKLQSQQPKPPQ